MVSNQEDIESDEYKNFSYSELSDIVRQKAKVTGNSFIPILYKKLLDERKTPKEAKLLLEHDFKDIWSITYINEFIPPEAKDEIKAESGKKGQKKKQELAISNKGDVIHDESRAKLSQAEQAPVSQTKPNLASVVIPTKTISDHREEDKQIIEEVVKPIIEAKKELKITMSKNTALKFANELRLDVFRLPKDGKVEFIMDMNDESLTYELV